MFCKKSILDSTYPGIIFDKNGISSIYKESKSAHDFFLDNNWLNLNQ